MIGTWRDTVAWLQESPDWEQALIELRGIRRRESDLQKSKAYLVEYIRGALDLSDLDEDPDFLTNEYYERDGF